jgi:predicted dehydrogenase
MLHLGIAGVGGLGQLHLKNYRTRRDVRVVALATRTGVISRGQTNLAETGASLVPPGAVLHRGYEAVCDDPQIDVVSINLPTDLHAPAAIRALEAGKHVFCEKPIARHPADARRMLDAARAAGKLLMIGHCLRFFPEYVAADELIRSGRFGRVLGASFTRCGGLPTWGSEQWFVNYARSGGAVIDLHIHDVDVALWWWGRPDRIEATGLAPNLIYSRWHYAHGLIVQFECAWDPAFRSPFYYNFKIILERASLLFDTRTGAGLQLATTDKLEAVPTTGRNGYAAEDDFFLDAVLRGGDLARCPPAAALDALELATATAAQLPAAR